MEEYEDVEREITGLGAIGVQNSVAVSENGEVVYDIPTPVMFGEDTSSMYEDPPGSPELLINLKSVKTESFLWIRKLLLLAILFSVSFSMVFALFLSLPKLRTLQPEEKQTLIDVDGRIAIGKLIGGEMEEEHILLMTIPKNLEELRVVRRTLVLYQKEYRKQVQIGIICLYLFLQAFMIPGSIFINILAGSLYGFYEALIMVTLLAAFGSSLCYCLSNCVLKEIVYYYFPDRCQWLAREVHRHRHDLLNYILFLRLTPLLPNWFINVSAPLVSIPLREFFVGTLIGVIPAGVIAVKAGSILSQINSLADLYDWKTIATLTFIAILSILPVVFKSRLDGLRAGFPAKKT